MAISDYITTDFVIGAGIGTFCLAGTLSLLVLILIGGESLAQYNAVLIAWGIASSLWFIFRVIMLFKWHPRVSAAMGLNKVRGGDRIGGNREGRRKQAKKEDTTHRAEFSRH